MNKELLFSIEEGDKIHLHINETIIIVFKNLDEWKSFAESMLHMIPEISDTLR